MHPTADTRAAINLCVAGRRVMPGVRPLPSHRTFMHITRLSLGVMLLLWGAGVAPAEGHTRIIKGRYHNPAEGFSIRVPRGLKGIAGDEAGPERGVTIILGGGRKIVVYGEPNSLEWKDQAQALRRVIKDEGPDLGDAAVTPIRLGSLAASRVTFKSMNRALEMAVAFRPGGGPVYWARLESDRRHSPHDHQVFMKVIQSFRVEAWK
jgi:hypothetical protein